MEPRECTYVLPAYVLALWRELNQTETKRTPVRDVPEFFFSFLLLHFSAAEQIISQYQTADDKEKSKYGFRYKKEHCHSQAKAEQHKPAYSFHILIPPNFRSKRIPTIVHHMQKIFFSLLLDNLRSRAKIDNR